MRAAWTRARPRSSPSSRMPGCAPRAAPPALARRARKHAAGLRRPRCRRGASCVCSRPWPPTRSSGGSHVAVPALPAAGLENARPYDLRHSFASLLLHEDRSPNYVARQLGHGAALTMEPTGMPSTSWRTRRACPPRTRSARRARHETATHVRLSLASRSPRRPDESVSPVNTGRPDLDSNQGPTP